MPPNLTAPSALRPRGLAYFITMNGQEVIELIKRRNIPMNGIAELIDELVEADNEARQFDEPKPTQEMVLYALDQLKECLNETDIYSKIRELEFEACRLMPPSIF